MTDKRLLLGILAVLVWGVAARSPAEERRQSFDSEPGWDGYHHRPTVAVGQLVRQDFGFSPTRHARGAAAGELGGRITPAAEPAYVAKRLATKSLQDRLVASGTFLAEGRQFHVLLGFFHRETLNTWRAANTIALRLYGRGDVFYAYVEYATARWRAGSAQLLPVTEAREPQDGQSAREGFAAGRAHRWSLTYEPGGNGSRGVVTATLGGARAVCHLEPGHKQDGGRFDRCGLATVMKHYDQGGRVWIDDVAINGQREEFSAAPDWEQFHNRRSYATSDVRPRFDFGYSATRFAGGRGRGELGGLVFRGDCREADRMAYYGDRLDRLTLNRRLRAGGKVALRRGVSDSTTLIGFFDAARSRAVSRSQRSAIPEHFLGAAIEGPSREGFFFYPVYRVRGEVQGIATGADRPRLAPDGRAHDWTLDYEPTAAGGRGAIRVTLDDRPVVLPLAAGHRSAAAHFDRFGIVTTWIDGNGQRVFFDDLIYTCR
ncbi:MAG: hypothetical protein CMJ59_21665 [Planctomycetaceae bacterium]|nr:hypothetical protein [Planctomycetaceae bacterium]